MTSPPKLLIDENVGRPITASISHLLRWHHLKPEVKHVLEFQEQGIPDNVWLEQIAHEDWIVISSDRGKKYGGPKLPRICQQLSVTHVLISSSLHQEKQFEKARAIVYLFPQIVDLAKERGGRYSMRYNTARNPVVIRVD